MWLDGYIPKFSDENASSILYTKDETGVLPKYWYSEDIAP